MIAPCYDTYMSIPLEPFSGAAVVMGVAGVGKSTIATLLAARLGARMIEGDRLHSAASIAKMSSGTPLTDEDRWPWLEQIGLALAGTDGAVAACSALKRVYRQTIARAAQRPVAFVLLKGDRALVESRMHLRTGHFMPASLLDSQFATLEEPGPDEIAVTQDLAQTPDAIADQVARFLQSHQLKQALAPRGDS
jgi:gluconokinase